MHAMLIEDTDPQGALSTHNASKRTISITLQYTQHQYLTMMKSLSLAFALLAASSSAFTSSWSTMSGSPLYMSEMTETAVEETMVEPTIAMSAEAALPEASRDI